MRNISFDESLVLGEYARIMTENTLVKEAAVAYPFLNEVNPFPSASNYLNDFWAKLNAGTEKDTKKLAALYAKEKNNVVNAIFAKFKTAPGFEPVFKQFKDQVTNLALTEKVPGPTEPITPRDEVFTPPAVPPTVPATIGSKEEENVKTAKGDQLYDVSGETGEDLIYSAHPETAIVEVSNSKTKENVVENIIEQQQRDIEVVNKVPKGTYAALVDIYNKLQKEGKLEILPQLAEVIDEIATPEEVVTHTLATLANELDACGMMKQADQVDELLKKFALNYSVQQIREKLIAEFKSWLNWRSPKNPSETESYEEIELVLAAMPVKSVSSIVNYINNALSKYTALVPGIRQKWNELVEELNINVIVDAEAKLQKPGGTPGAGTPPPLEPIPGQKKKLVKDPEVEAWQKKYNELVGAKRKHLVPDGIRGRLTIAAENEVSAAGGWEAFKKFVNSGVAAYSPAAQPQQPKQPQQPAPAIDYTRFDDIRSLLEQKVIQRLGADGAEQVKSTEWTKWINNQATILYGLQGREGKDGPPKYTPGEVIQQVERAVKDL